MLTLQTSSLRLSLAPTLGAGIADFSLKGPGGYFFPLMRRAAPEEANASLLASFFMAPWVNRIRAGKFHFAGRDYAISTNTSDHMAQHGDVRKRPWRTTMTAANAATLEFDSADLSDINWPWPFACRAIYQLLPLPAPTPDPKPESRNPIPGGILRIDLLVRNLSTEPMPAACGHHPYFMRTLFSSDDELQLQVPVTARYPLKDGCAIAPPTPHTEDDLTRRLRAGGPVPSEHIDAVFAVSLLPPLPLGEGRGGGGEGSPPSLPASPTSPSASSSSSSSSSSKSSSSSPPPITNTAQLHWPASKVTLRITASPNMSHWVVYAPHEKPTPTAAPTPLPYIAVEPQTQVNDALNLAAVPAPHGVPLPQTGTVTLAPGEELITHCEFEVTTH